VGRITPEDIARFHQEHYRLRDATLAVVGEVDPQAVLAQIKEALGGQQELEQYQQGLKQLWPPFPPVAGVSVAVVDRPGSVQSNIFVTGRGVARNDPDLPALSVLNSVLGGGMSGRLFANLREKHGFTYGAYSGFSAKKLGGAFTAAAEVRNEVTGAATAEILAELERINKEPIPEAELALQRNFLIGNFLMSVENDQRTAERQQEIVLYGLPADYFKTYAQKLAAVTPQQAQALAQKHLDTRDLYIIAVGEAKEIVPQLARFGKVTVYDTDLKAKPAPAQN